MTVDPPSAPCRSFLFNKSFFDYSVSPIVPIYEGVPYRLNILE